MKRLGSSSLTLSAFCPCAITQQQVVHGHGGLCASAEECVREIRILLERLARASATTKHNGEA